MIKSIFCLCFIFAAAFLGFADPEAAAPVSKEPEKTASPEATEDNDSVYAIPFYYSDKESFYTLLGGWKNNCFYYAGSPLLAYASFNKGGHAFIYLCFLGGTLWSEKGYQVSYLFPLYLYTKDSNEIMLMSLFMGTHWNNEVFYFFPPLYILDIYPKYSWVGTEKDEDKGYRHLSSQWGYSDSCILWPFGRVRIIDDPSENMSKIQGQFFPLFGYYEDDFSAMNWLVFPLYFYKNGYRSEKDKDNKVKPVLNSEMLVTFPFYFYSGNDYNKETYRNFLLLAGTYDGQDHSSFYILPFYSFSGKGENKESGFSFAWRLFSIKNDEEGLKRLDIFFIPFYDKAGEKK